MLSRRGHRRCLCLVAILATALVVCACATTAPPSLESARQLELTAEQGYTLAHSEVFDAAGFDLTATALSPQHIRELQADFVDGYRWTYRLTDQDGKLTEIQVMAIAFNAPEHASATYQAYADTFARTLKLQPQATTLQLGALGDERAGYTTLAATDRGTSFAIFRQANVVVTLFVQTPDASSGAVAARAATNLSARVR